MTRAQMKRVKRIFFYFLYLSLLFIVLSRATHRQNVFSVPRQAVPSGPEPLSNSWSDRNLPSCQQLIPATPVSLHVSGQVGIIYHFPLSYIFFYFNFSVFICITQSLNRVKSAFDIFCFAVYDRVSHLYFFLFFSYGLRRLTSVEELLSS